MRKPEQRTSSDSHRRRATVAPGVAALALVWLAAMAFLLLVNLRTGSSIPTSGPSAGQAIWIERFERPIQ